MSFGRLSSTFLVSRSSKSLQVSLYRLYRTSLMQRSHSDTLHMKVASTSARRPGGSPCSSFYPLTVTLKAYMRVTMSTFGRADDVRTTNLKA